MTATDWGHMHEFWSKLKGWDLRPRQDFGAIQSANWAKRMVLAQSSTSVLALAFLPVPSVALAVALLVPAMGRALDESPSAPTVPRWGLFETTVANPRIYANPFTDVTLNTTFIRPDGSTVSFWGFYDGDGKGAQTGSVWRFRFMPDQVGTWSYRCSFSDGAPGKGGPFECAAAGAKPGPLRVDRDNPRWFKFADGSRRLLHGYYYLDFWSDFGEAWSNVVHNIVLADGYTMLMPMSYIRGPETKAAGEIGQDIERTYAWVTRGDNVDWDRLDLATWKRLDERLTWAADHNLVVYNFDGLFPQSDYGAKLIPADKEELYLRYNLARHAPYWNVLWNLGAEMWKGGGLPYPSDRKEEGSEKNQATPQKDVKVRLRSRSRMAPVSPG